MVIKSQQYVKEDKISFPNIKVYTLIGKKFTSDSIWNVNECFKASPNKYFGKLHSLVIFFTMSLNVLLNLS